jgi:DNA-binding NtrC family response regulator
VAGGRFRQDLLLCLDVLRLRLPAVAEHRQDIALFSLHFLW